MQKCYWNCFETLIVFKLGEKKNNIEDPKWSSRRAYYDSDLELAFTFSFL